MKNASVGTSDDAAQALRVFHRDEEVSGRLGAPRRRPLERRGRNERCASALGERGYALLVVLIALAIVGWLARDSIKQMFAAVTSGTGKGQSHVPPAPPVDRAQATPSPAAPVDRARSAEEIVLQRAGETGKRIDAAQ